MCQPGRPLPQGDSQYGYEPIRYLMISSHYRSPINYSVDIIEQCKASLDRLYTCRDNLDFLLGSAADGELDADFAAKAEAHRQKFIEAMDDDLNTADALSAVFTLVRDINTAANGASKQTLEAAAKLFDELTGVLGLVYNRKSDDLDAEIEDLIAQRAAARKEKNWAKADEIRDKIKAMGIVLEDTPQGVKWHKE